MFSADTLSNLANIVIFISFSMAPTVIEHIRMLLAPPRAGLSTFQINNLASALYGILRQEKWEIWDASEGDLERLNVETARAKGLWSMSLTLYKSDGQWDLVCLGQPETSQENAILGLYRHLYGLDSV